MSTTLGLAWLYVRWSDAAKQSDGDSESRQMAAISAWCSARGYATDPARLLMDRGRSGFAGHNLSKGALGKFVRDVELRRVPEGSMLVVESLDRITRLPISDATRLIDLLTRGGVSVGVVDTNEVFTAKTNNQLNSVLALAIRVSLSHEESAKKRERQSAVWVRKRARAASTGEPVTGAGPGWLSLVDGAWTLNEHASTVARMFALTLLNHGGDRIATVLNREGVPLFSRSKKARIWSGSAVLHVLKSRAAYGAWQPRTASRTLSDGKVEIAKGVTATEYTARTIRAAEGKPIEGYYPAVVSRDDWDRAQQLIANRTDGGGGKGKMSNVLQGVLFCAACGGRIQRSQHRLGLKHDVLVCTTARAGECAARRSVRADPIAEAILERAVEAFEIVSNRSNPERHRLMALIDQLEGQKAEKQAGLDALIAALGGKVTPAVAAAFAGMAEDVAAFEAQIGEHRRALVALDAAVTERPMEYLSLLVDYRSGKGEARDRAIRLLNAALRSVIGAIHLNVGSDKGPGGYWVMDTVNHWARIKSTWKHWHLEHELAEALEAEPDEGGHYAEAFKRRGHEGRDVAARIAARERQ